jgi:hypothetical protein
LWKINLYYLQWLCLQPGIGLQKYWFPMSETDKQMLSIAAVQQGWFLP